MKNIEFDYSRLEGRIIEKFKTRKAFADAIGTSAGLLSRKLNGQVSFGDEERYKMMPLLGLTIDDIGSYFFTIKVKKN